MARPAKAVATQNANLTAEEKRVRVETENALKGKADKLLPPKYLNPEQRRVFKNIVTELSSAEILGNLDVYVLTSFAIAVERLARIEDMVNHDPDLLNSSTLMATKDKYTRDLYRGCNELCLSPQSRAKIGTINMQALKMGENPILAVLNDSATS